MYYNNIKNALTAPAVVALEAKDKRSDGLVPGARLQLVVRAPVLLAAVAREQVRRGNHVLRDHVLVALVLLVDEARPLLRRKLLVRRKRDIFGLNARQQARNRPQIVVDRLPFRHVHVEKELVGPLADNHPLLAGAHGVVEDAALDILRVLARQRAQLGHHVGLKTSWVVQHSKGDVFCL